MKYGIRILIIMVLTSFYGLAQQAPAKRQATDKNTKTTRETHTRTLPPWAEAQHYNATQHAYFPDYYTFYDPARGGYLYWDKNNYTFSPTIPPFMEKANLAKTRVKILEGLSLDLHPELNYPYYMNLYPADPNGNTLVPVPTPGNPANPNR
jgi:hypothetical protein